MKVSINLAQAYSSVDLKSISKDDMLRRIGSQLGAVEEVIEWAPKFDGITVVQIVDCQKHPNADKLHVCKIDDGQKVKNVERGKDGYVQVVCGAPNVATGMYVAWIPPRATVPVTRGTSDELVLEARELRGVMSNGMLASAHELGINDDHSGILGITEESAGRKLVAGEPLHQFFGLDDIVIDCENKMFTHRPDCFGNLGVARELAGINGLNFRSPDWYINSIPSVGGGTLPFVSDNLAPKLVSRFMAQVVENVTILPSSTNIQVTLARVGLRSVNNIVDATNFYMHLTAQPTHAFDYDKIKAISGKSPTIFPRMAVDGEEITLLNGKTIKLTEDDIVIATDTKVVALAGVMGGIETEVDENTKNIIIECATFDMYAVRRTSMRHGIFTDAVTRFNKGQSPLQNDKVLTKLVAGIVEDCGAKAGVVIDLFDSEAFANQNVGVTAQFISTRLGKEFSSEEIADLLNRTEFNVNISGESLEIIAPFWRRDIECPEDIVEEVGRLYGFDALPTEMPTRKVVAPTRNRVMDIKRSLAHALKSYGANEVLTYSFVHGSLIANSNQSIDNAYQLRNAISPDLQYYRLSITPSLLQHVHANIKAGYGECALFEIGSIHSKKYGLDVEKVPVEKSTLAFVYAANEKNAKQMDGAAYFNTQKYLTSLMSGVGVSVQFEKINNDNGDEYLPFDPERSARIIDASSSETIGIIGEYASLTRNTLKLPTHSAGFEIFIDEVMRCGKPKQYKPHPKFPSMDQDITLEVNSEMAYAVVKSAIDNFLSGQARVSGYEVTVAAVDIYSDSSDKKRITLRLTITHLHHTLTTDEVNILMTSMANSLMGIGAERV